MMVRKCNFVALLKAFEEIADQSFKQHSVTDYDTIPFNDEKLHDVLLRNLTIERSGKPLLVDVAIRQNEKTIGSDYYVEGIVEDIGDLQDFYGYVDIDVAGTEFAPAKMYMEPFASLTDLDDTIVMGLLEKGYAAIIIENVIPGEFLHNLPIRVLTKKAIEFSQQLALGAQADFFLRKEGKNIYAVVNGYAIDLKKTMQQQYKNQIS